MAAEPYKHSMLKAFAKTVEESRFPFVILDAPNIQVEDFKPFYMAAQVPIQTSFGHTLPNFRLSAEKIMPMWRIGWSSGYYCVCAWDPDNQEILDNL